MKVQQLMTRRVVEVSLDDTCQQAAVLMANHQTGTLVATSAGHRIEGIITDRDLIVRCMAQGKRAENERIGDYIDRPAMTVNGDLELGDALEMMRCARLRRLPVVEDGRVVGIISLDDIAPDVKHYVDVFLGVAGQYRNREAQ